MDRKEICTQSVKLSDDGFDLLAGETWIYPTNYPTREYQFNIIQKALLKNTLVSLPTGLGKTFIAAVIMYNFYRWYPQGKIIFMAPTKPLVKQQVEACYNIMAIPSEVTAELTGDKTSVARTDVWSEKRVFYITPQVLQNDLHRIGQLGAHIKCLVFDEAHKARGNHAYCEVIRRLIAGGNKYFRVLALSATPGSTVNDVLDVIHNLLISHLEFRTEESLDVQQYVFQRSLETVVVPLSPKLQQVKDEYLKILEHYTKSLRNYKIIQGNCGSLTKGKIYMLMKEFKQKNKVSRSSHHSEIMKSLNICVTLYHAYELLIRHGLRNFLSFFQEHLEKPLLKGNYSLRAIVDDVRDHLGPISNVEVLPDGTYPEIPQNVKFGHPKYYKLREVLISHFSEGDPNTRVIVFFEYRESVMEAHMLLLQSRPLIQPKIFLGKGSGITQKFQIGVVKAFREGKCNTLLATCIGEEGLDVGEVDLIVCFDISTKSPIRMVQRMGRTGRKREGKVLVLVTEGKEQQTLKDCLIHKDNISTFVLGSKQLATGMYPGSPRMVPEGITPKCERIFITVKKKVLLKKKNSIKDLFSSMSSTSSSEPLFSDDIQIIEVQEKIPKCVMLFDKVEPLGISGHSFNTFDKHVELQRSLQTFYKIGPSKVTKEFVKLMQYADSKRFNIPTQSQSFSQNKILKQGDIRSMFLQPNSQQHFQTQKTKVPESIDKIISTQDLKNEPEAPPQHPILSCKELFTQISNYIFLHMSGTRKCKHCPEGFNCEDYAISSDKIDVQNNNWIPSEQILDDITPSDIAEFTKTLDPDYVSVDSMEIAQDDAIFEHVDFTRLEKQAEDESFHFQAPKSLSNILDKFGDRIFDSQRDTCDDLLHFFKLETLSDLFNSCADSSQETVLYSPDIVRRDSPGDGECLITSPELSSQNRLRSIREKVLGNSKRTQVQKKLFDEFNDKESKARICSTPVRETSPILFSPLNLGKSCNPKNIRTTVGASSDIDISDICDVTSFGLQTQTKVGISEFCDLSVFGMTYENESDLSRRNTNTAHVLKNPDLPSSKSAKILTDKSRTSWSLLDSNFGKSADLMTTVNANPDPCKKKQKPTWEPNANQISADELNQQTKKPDGTKKTLTIQPSTSWSLLEKKFGKYLSGTPPLASASVKSGDSDADVTFCEPPTQQRESTAGGCDGNIDDNLLDLVDESIIELVTQTNKPHIEATVDLTEDSPEKPLPRKLSVPTQLSITQMLSLINKTQENGASSSQKENDSSHINQTKSDSSNGHNGNRTPKKNLLSTRKDANIEFLYPTPKKQPKKPDIDPYEMITQRSSDRKGVATSTLETSSDDEFENPNRNQMFLKPSCGKVDLNSLRNGKPKAGSSKTQARKKTRNNPFIEAEAELSECDDVFVSDDESDRELDFYDASFVNDETQNMNTQMHLHYLKSVRSPAIRGGLKIASKPPLAVSNIYSQIVDTENDTYIEDSFVVGAKDEELTQRHDLSELEILERKLKKKKKRKKSDEKSHSGKRKRRRIVSVSSEDSN